MFNQRRLIKDKGDWGFFQTRGFVLSLILIAIIAVSTLTYYSLTRTRTSRLAEVPNLYGDFRYEVIEIEGMPCVVAAGGSYFGITCDWTKWQGE